MDQRAVGKYAEVVLRYRGRRLPKSSIIATAASVNTLSLARLKNYCLCLQKEGTTWSEIFIDKYAREFQSTVTSPGQSLRLCRLDCRSLSTKIAFPRSQPSLRGPCFTILSSAPWTTKKRNCPSTAKLSLLSPETLLPSVASTCIPLTISECRRSNSQKNEPL